MALIDREALLTALRARGRELLKLGTSFEANIASVAALECINIVKDAPAVDAEPVRRGEWIRQDETYTRYMCSECKGRNYPGGQNYCPNCGARMTKEEMNE